jgi:hypothetical protein
MTGVDVARQAPQAGQAGTVAASPPAKRPRDIRLDIFRGLALLFITVTHTGGNWLVEFLPSHFGFSSGTEMFVFCSGIASGLAFGPLFVKRGFAMGMVRVGHRIWQIYWAHVATFAAILAMTVWLASTLGKPAFFVDLQQDVFLTHPRQAIVGLMTLTYLPSLFDILPLYIVLLAMIPVVMLARRIMPTLPFILVGAAYLYVWTVGVFLPADPTDPSKHWLFNPFGWQLVFFTGFFIAMKWLPVPAPGTPWAVAASLAVLALSVPFSAPLLYGHVDLFGFIRDAILPGSERSNFHILRFVHFLALAYLAVSALAAAPKLAETGAARVLAMTGRETLAGFLASIPVSILAGTLIDMKGGGFAVVLLATILSWGAVMAAAILAGWIKSKPWTAPQARPAPQPASIVVPGPAIGAPALTPVPVRVRGA